MKRRNFLKLSGAGATLSGLSACGGDSDSNTNNVQPPVDGGGGVGDGGGPLPQSFDVMENQPRRVSSVNGVLDYEMSIEYANPVVNGIPLTYRTYNGRLAPDTLVIRPGDLMKIHLVNNLPKTAEDDFHPPNPNIPHGFNNINLHTHGLNVSPSDDQDNILITLHPGEDFHYNIQLPPDHPTGTYWYHPHKHGSALHQLASGMAGFIVIEGEGDLSDLPELRNAKTVELAFHELIIDGNGKVPGEGPALDERNPIWNMFRGQAFLQYTINGLAVNQGADFATGLGGTPPVLRMRPGEVQRWRLGLLCHLQTYKFALQGHKIYVASWDGITDEKMEEYDESHGLILGPGNRADIIVKASDTPGTYAFNMLTEQFGEFPLFVTPSVFAETLPVFNVIVEGEPMNMSLPAALNPPSQRLPYIPPGEITRRRHIKFEIVGDVFIDFDTFVFQGDTRQYFVNNLKFSATRINHTVLLNTAEEWEITNIHPSHNKSLRVNHPFHIHVNWIQVMEVQHPDGKVETFNDGRGRWMDNIDVPFGGKAIVRHRFEKFTGILPFHCHVIAHEDEGMMNLVEIIDPTPISARITTTNGGTLQSVDATHRVKAEFARGSFPVDVTVTYTINLDPKHPAPEGMVGMDRYFRLTSELGRPTNAAIVTVQFPLELPDGSTYDPETVTLYRSTGSGWTTQDVIPLSRGESSVFDGPVELPVRYVTSSISNFGTGDFALMAKMLSPAPTTPQLTPDVTTLSHA